MANAYIVSNKSMQLLTLMHGQIAIESTVGVGSKATVIIPMQVARKVGTGGLLTPPQEQLNPLDDVGSSPSDVMSLSPAERLDTHILLVEDKCVLSVSSSILPPLPVFFLPSHNTRKRNHSHSISYLSRLSSCRVPDTNLGDPNSAINRRIAMKTIRKLGFTNVAAANDGRQALDYLINLKNTIPRTVPPAVILMDVQMPVMDGYEATYKLRHEEPFISDNDLRDVPVVALTASAIQGDREKCFEKGMSDYLSKPFSTEALDRMIVKWAVKRRNERGKNRTKS